MRRAHDHAAQLWDSQLSSHLNDQDATDYCSVRLQSECATNFFNSRNQDIEVLLCKGPGRNASISSSENASSDEPRAKLACAVVLEIDGRKGEDKRFQAS